MKLHLIDYDEARLKDIDKRKPTNDRQKRRYVQSLLKSKEHKAYTKNQIVNLFCECWEVLFMENETNEIVNNAANKFMGKYYGHFKKKDEHTCSVGEVNGFFDEMMTFWPQHPSLEKSMRGLGTIDE